MKKYPKELEQIIIETVKNMKGKNTTEIVSCLNSRGITNANGGRFTEGALAYFIGSRKELTGIEEKIIPSISRLVVEALLTEPTLSDRQRITMLQAYVNS